MDLILRIPFGKALPGEEAGEVWNRRPGGVPKPDLPRERSDRPAKPSSFGASIGVVPTGRASLSSRGDGTALVGLNLSPPDVPGVKQRLGIGTPLAEATPAEILDLLAGGAIIELDKGWRLITARIAGDEVVELVLNGVPANSEELRRKWLSEEIVGHKRRWFAISDVAPDVVPRLLAQRRAIARITSTGA